MKVSEKRFNEFKNRAENNPIWLAFREKVFGFSKEDLIMHPRSIVILANNVTIAFHGEGKFGVATETERRFRYYPTLDEAYSEAMKS